MKMKRIGCLLMTVLFLISILAGCSKNSETTPTNTGTTTGTVKDTVNIWISADIGTLDPYKTSANIDNGIEQQIFNVLVNTDPNANVVPELVESWQISDDGLTYTFYLAKGVKFHNGDELKASDVEFSIKTAKESPYLASFTTAIKDVTAVDDYTVKVDLEYPYAPFLQNLASIYIVGEKSYIEAGENFAKNPIGSGPYKFVKHEVGQSVVLERFDDYFEGAPKIKTVNYKVITDPNTALVAFQSGDIDVNTNPPKVSKDLLMNDPKYAAYTLELRTLYYVLMNLNAKPFDNLLVRQAINYAIDKNNCIQVAEEGMGKKADQALNDQTFGYSPDVKGYEYNIDKAKELLARAGYPDGFKVTLRTLDGNFKKNAEVIQGYLSKIGITVEIQMQEQNALIQDLMNGNYEMALMGITLGLDADNWSMVFSSNGGFNMSQYKNPEIDELFQKGAKLTDSNERIAIYKQIFQKINDDAVIVPLYNPTRLIVTAKDLKIGELNGTKDLYVKQMEWVQ